MTKKTTTAPEWTRVEMGKGCIRWTYGPQGGGRRKEDYARVDYDPKRGTTDGTRKYLAEVKTGTNCTGGYYENGIEAQARVEEIYASHHRSVAFDLARKKANKDALIAATGGAPKAKKVSKGTHTTYAADGKRTVTERKPAPKKPKAGAFPPITPKRPPVTAKEHAAQADAHGVANGFVHNRAIAAIEADLRAKAAALVAQAVEVWLPVQTAPVATSVERLADEVGREPRKLTTKLTDDDVDDCVHDLAAVVTKAGAIEAVIALVRDGLRPLAKHLARTHADLVSLVQKRERTEQVECAFRFPAGAQLVDVVRTDTGAVIESRPPTAQERQQSLIW